MSHSYLPLKNALVRLPQRMLMSLVRTYRYLLSPWLGSGCRFEPTCSAYALEALERHGAAAGTYLTMHRLVRCNPLCVGGHDPVPTQPPGLFSHLVIGASKMPENPSHPKTPEFIP
jgi:putative membrane protein insertion efficiency factor